MVLAVPTAVSHSGAPYPKRSFYIFREVEHLLKKCLFYGYKHRNIEKHSKGKIHFNKFPLFWSYLIYISLKVYNGG